MSQRTPEQPFNFDNDDIWEQALPEFDLPESAYDLIPLDDISQAAKNNPLKAELMQLANRFLQRARDQAEGEISREKSQHDTGWDIVIETPLGVVGLHSDWQGKGFYLGLPLTATKAVSDRLIMTILSVTKSEPVKHIDSVVVNDLKYRGQYKDLDKPLELNEAGQVVAYKDMGVRQWGSFYGPRRVDGGRVWVDLTRRYSGTFDFRYQTESGLSSVHYGFDNAISILTFPFNFCNKYAPDGPTTNPEVMQKYRDKFIELASRISFNLGKPISVNLNYDFVMVPEDLAREGWEATWLRGIPGERNGFGKELVKGTKGDATLYLESANSIVPWRTVLNVPINNINSPAILTNFIIQDLLYF